MFKAYENGWKSIVQPERFPYNSYDLGPEIKFLEEKNAYMGRIDFTFKNKKNLKLKGTFYHQIYNIEEYRKKSRESNQENIKPKKRKKKKEIGFFVDFQAKIKKRNRTEEFDDDTNHKEIIFENPKKEKPCLIYLHSHSANRVEGTALLEHITPEFDLCVFDFSGCGKSQGKFVTLGLKERYDLQSVIEFLKKKFFVKDFFLWGRSMGAVTAILFASKFKNFQNLRGMVLDSPFNCAKTMVKNFFLRNF